MNTPLKSLLPSKKFTIAVAILIVIIVVIVILTRNEAPQESNDYSNITIGNIIDKDSDKDGVPDWQEKLYGLRLDLPDSDNDGISDRDEIMEYQAIAGEDRDPLNNTETLSHDMYVIIAALSQGGELNPTIQASLSDLLSAYIASDNELTPFTEDDLDLMHDSLAATGLYATEYAEIMLTLQDTPDPTVLIEEAVRENNPDILLPLGELATTYENAVINLKKIPTSYEIAPYHLLIMNALNNIAYDISQIAQYFEDPLLTFSGLVLYNEHIEDYIMATEALHSDVLEPLANGLQ